VPGQTGPEGDGSIRPFTFVLILTERAARGRLEETPPA
jgi:hypothetical protein